MTVSRRTFAIAATTGLAWVGMGGASPAQSNGASAAEVQRAWYKLILELVRHTPTYSPPVASRAFAYIGVAAFEAMAGGTGGLHSLAGQLNGLKPVPQRMPGQVYDDAAILHATLAWATRSLFENTGPTGQRVMLALDRKLGARTSDGLAGDVAARSRDYGEAVARHILDWAREDGGAVIENLGFPAQYELTKGASNWVPTSLIPLQQKPLLPFWGNNRTFAMPDGGACPLPPPPEYSEEVSSAFYREALEVYETKRSLTPEQRAIARFWSDDPMLSPTPPGHWISIALQIIERDDLAIERSVDVMARLGIVLADSFIACWHSKFVYDLLRPVTYIRRLIDKTWESTLITPPFPEYPSGHSTQSGAAAAVLTEFFGENFSFEDDTHKRDGMKPRSFASFDAAAREAGISRLFGGIHYRAAIERGLEQGRCVSTFTNALRTRS